MTIIVCKIFFVLNIFANFIFKEDKFWLVFTYQLLLNVQECRFENLPICLCSNKKNTLKISLS